MLNIEAADAINGTDIYELSEKIAYKQNLNNEDKEVKEICDAWVKEVADKADPDREIAAFVRRTVNEEIYNAPDELLDMIFDRGTVGEFDDYEMVKDPKNTLVAHDAAKGGTVDRSWIDFSAIAPVWKNKQIETDLSYVDMRKNGFKSVALLTTYAVETLKNSMFYDMFSAADQAITGGEQLISETAANPSQASMDKLALYLTDRDPNGAVAIALTKYCQAMGRMAGFAEYMSEAMKDEFNRYGLIRFFSGIRVAGISSAKKQGNGELIFPDKRIFGIAGKIGNLDMKGDIHVYEDFDNQKELIKLTIKDFTFGYAITHIDKIAKIEING